VVVEGHAGDVEGVCFGGVAGELDDERLCFLVLEGGACPARSVSAVEVREASRRGGLPSVDAFSSSMMCCW
jgi:hypothetical protein